MTALDLALGIQLAIIASYGDRTPEQVRDRIRAVIASLIAEAKAVTPETPDAKYYRETIVEPAHRLMVAICTHESVFNRTCLLCGICVDAPDKGARE